MASSRGASESETREAGREGRKDQNCRLRTSKEDNSGKEDAVHLKEEGGADMDRGGGSPRC
jgi:hypothetical protein